MMLVRYVWLVLMSSCAISVRAEIASGSSKTGGGGGGWLDRLVLFFKDKFVDDVERAQNVKIDVTLEKAPEGYVDSPEWNETSVLRLLSLVRQTEEARPVRRAIRRALRPILTRRFYYTPMDSRIMFPSLKKVDSNHFYYSDTESDEMDRDGNANKHVEYVDSYEDMDSNDQDAEQWKKRREEFEASRKNVVVVRNPVEARLPSSRISIDLLRKIMEERAQAARQAPTSTKVTLTWLPRYNVTSKMGTTSKAPDEGGASEADGEGGAAADGEAKDGGEAEGGGEAEDSGEEEGEGGEGEGSGAEGEGEGSGAEGSGGGQ